VGHRDMSTYVANKIQFNLCNFAVLQSGLWAVRQCLVLFISRRQCALGVVLLMRCSAMRTLGITSFTPKAETDRITLETFSREAYVMLPYLPSW